MTRTSSKINRIAQIILARDGYKYIHDPEHRDKPHGTFWPTEKGWSNDPKYSNDHAQEPTQQFSSPVDNAYFQSLQDYDDEAVKEIVRKTAEQAGYKPVLVYHSNEDNYDFTQFDIDRISYDQAFGRGFYFGDDKDFVNQNYGGHARGFFLKMDNPYTASKSSDLLDVLKRQGVRVTPQDYDYYSTKWLRYIFKDFDADNVTKALKREGYDGVIHQGEHIVWDRNR